MCRHGRFRGDNATSRSVRWPPRLAARVPTVTQVFGCYWALLSPSVRLTSHGDPEDVRGHRQASEQVQECGDADGETADRPHCAWSLTYAPDLPACAGRPAVAARRGR